MSLTCLKPPSRPAIRMSAMASRRRSLRNLPHRTMIVTWAICLGSSRISRMSSFIGSGPPPRGFLAADAGRDIGEPPRVGVDEGARLGAELRQQREDGVGVAELHHHVAVRDRFAPVELGDQPREVVPHALEPPLL